MSADEVADIDDPEVVDLIRVIAILVTRLGGNATITERELVSQDDRKLVVEDSDPSGGWVLSVPGLVSSPDGDGA